MTTELAKGTPERVRLALERGLQRFARPANTAIEAWSAIEPIVTALYARVAELEARPWEKHAETIRKALTDASALRRDVSQCTDCVRLQFRHGDDEAVCPDHAKDALLAGDYDKARADLFGHREDAH